MNATNPFVGMFPGFDFLRQAASGPISNLPGLGTWLPTLDPRELDSRVNELKTVLFWLEQNTAIVKSTIQALEVQKMTLSTLGAMNVGMAEMAKAFTMPMPAAPAPGAWPFATSVSGVPPQAGDAAEGKAAKDGSEGGKQTAGEAPPLTPAEQVAASMAAPAQMWWNALNAQFQQLAGNVAQQQAAVEAAAAQTTAQMAEAAAEVAEAAAGMAAAAGQGAAGNNSDAGSASSKPATRKKAASSSKGEEKGK